MQDLYYTVCFPFDQTFQFHFRTFSVANETVVFFGIFEDEDNLARCVHWQTFENFLTRISVLFGSSLNLRNSKLNGVNRNLSKEI